MRLKRSIFWILLLATTRVLCAAESGPDAKPVLLLTGFEPFGGLKVNASWETVKRFQGREILGYRVETALLPVVYDEMDAPLQAALVKHKPAIAISFGVGSQVIQIETAASNSYHPQRPPDNKGKPPPRDKIAPDAPVLPIPTALPAAAIVAALKEAKIGAGSSADAGGYLCNECFYRLMSSKNAPAVRGFVHVPDFGTPDPAGGVFDAEKLAKAVQIVMETTIRQSKQSEK